MRGQTDLLELHAVDATDRHQQSSSWKLGRLLCDMVTISVGCVVGFVAGSVPVLLALVFKCLFSAHTNIFLLLPVLSFFLFVKRMDPLGDSRREGEPHCNTVG